MKTKEERKEYNKEYYLKNKECIIKNVKLYSENNKKSISLRHKKYYIKNRERILKTAKKYRDSHKLAIAAYKKIYYNANIEKIRIHKKNYRQNNFEKLKMAKQKYVSENSDLVKERKRKYRKSEIGRAAIYRAINKRRSKFEEIESTLTCEEWNNILEKFDYCCAYCGEKLEMKDHKSPLYKTMDHVIPISKNGHHTKDNVVPSHMICNLKKADKIL